MNKYAKRLTKSPANAFLFFALLLGAIVYLIPWLINSSISMTLSGWDLAEWASLHPAVRFGDPNLTASLYLRLPPVLLILIFALNVSYPRFTGNWWLVAGVVLIGALMLAPPPEFFNDTGDVNYRQQFTLAVITFIGGLFALSGLLSAIRLLLTFILCLIGIFVTFSGLEKVHSLMAGLQPSVMIGLGGFLSMGIFILIAGLVIIILVRDDMP